MNRVGLKHIALSRFPLKPARDLLSLAQILVRGDVVYQEPLSFKKRLECIGFYFSADGIRRLQVAPRRAGSRWLQLGVALALDLANGGDGEYDFKDEVFYPRDGLIFRRLDWRVPTGAAEKKHTRTSGPILGEQYFFAFHQPYSRIRCAALKNMKIVVVTRSILAILESQYFKLATAPAFPGVTLDDESSFAWDAYLTQAIEFFNSWGDVLTWHRHIRHYKYEDLKADPVSTHKEILNFWGFDVPEDCVAEGFRRASKKEMLKRMSPAEQKRTIRVSTRGTDQRGIISEARKRHIVDRLNRELIYDFGYNLDYDTEYGVAYD